jgi:hypothetical protein
MDSDQALAAIDPELRARDVAGCVGGEE